MQLITHLTATPIAMMFLVDADFSQRFLVLFVILGLVSGQTSLTALWLVLGTGSILRRGPLTLFGWALSLFVLHGLVARADLQLFVATTLLFLVHLTWLSAALAITRGFFGWQSGHLRELNNSERPNQFTLRQMFVWMSGCAALTAAIKLLYNTGVWRSGEIEYFHFLRIGAYPLLMCSLCSILPICVAALRWNISVWAIAAALITMVFTGFESLHPWCTVASGYVVFDFHLLMWLNGTHAAWFAVNLLILRLSGYCLERVA